MNTNFIMLRELLKVYEPQQEGVATAEEVDLIVSTLHTEEMDILQLRNLRDFAVMYISHLSSDEDDAEQRKNMDKISAITSVIDHRIFSLGGEV